MTIANYVGSLKFVAESVAETAMSGDPMNALQLITVLGFVAGLMGLLLAFSQDSGQRAKWIGVVSFLVCIFSLVLWMFATATQK